MPEPTQLHTPEPPARLQEPNTTQTTAGAEASGASTLVGDSTPTTTGGAPAITGYELLGELGHGAMGVVYKARDLRLNRVVALKMILGKDQSDPKHLIRFLAEAEAIAAVKHPNIVQVYEFGEAGGQPYIALEHLPGGTLSARLGAALSAHSAAGLLAAVARGVAAAHDQSIVHRDLKPGNILFNEEGIPKVTDFGLAKRGTGSGLTETHAVMGTPAYMSPEQAWGNTKFVGPTADVWALGVILYEATTGTRPFDADDIRSLLTQVVTAEPIRPTKLKPSISRDLELICLKCLSKQPHERYPTAKELADDLDRFTRGESISVRPPSFAERIGKWAKRNRLLVGTAVLVLVLGAAFAWWADQVARDRREAQLRQQIEDERRAGEERRRLDRNAAIVAGLLDRSEAALRAVDTATAALTLDQAARSTAEGGADHLADRATRDRTELTLLGDLDRIDEVRWTMDSAFTWSKRAVRNDWPAVFAQFGIVPGTTPVDQAVARINGSAIRDRMLAALHLWLVKSRSPRLNMILNSADPDNYRSALRAAVCGRDDNRAAILATRPEALAQPPWFWEFLTDLQSLPTARRAELLAAAYRQQPGNVNVLFGLAQLRAVGAPDAGVEREKWMRAAVAVRPRSAAARNNLGVALYEQRKLDEAMAVYRQAIELGSGSALAHNNLGVALLEKGDHEGAIAEYRKAIELDPDDPHAHNNLGNLLREKRQWDEAIAEFQRAITLNPDFAPAYNNLGNVLKDKGDRKGAIAAYREAIRLDPTNVKVYFNLAGVLKDVRDWDASIAAYHEALKLEPDDAETHNDLGVAHFFKGDLDGAIAAYQAAIKLDPNLLIARNNLGNALRDKNDLPGAVAAYREALKVNPRYAPALHNLGKVLQKQGDLDGAVAAYTEAIKSEPKFRPVYDDLGLVYFLQKKWDKAAAVYRQAIKLTPKDAAAHANLGLILLYADDRPGAIAAFTQALALNPKDAKTHLNLGSVYLAEEKFPETIACARAALALEPNNAGAHAQLGLALQDTGDIPGARAALTEAARLDPKRWGPYLAKLPPPQPAPPPRPVKQ